MTDFEYKYIISDKLALGYGSKYQLLRMLGWHRNFFNEEIGKATNLSKNISWYDFNFHGPEDKEILNANYLDKPISELWNNYWPTYNGSKGINWDAVGVSDDTYILVEAKANIEECKSSNNPGGKSVAQVRKCFDDFQKKYNIENNDWANPNYYQLANRLVHLDFLLSNNIKAKLVYVLFVNGYMFNTKNIEKNVSNMSTWKNKIDDLFKKMKIKDTVVESMINFCFIDCNKFQK